MPIHPDYPIPDPTAEQNRRVLRYLDPIERARLDRIAERINAARVQASLSETFRTLTPNDAANWIETNVKDLASAKAALKIMARILVAMRDQIWPDLPE